MRDRTIQRHVIPEVLDQLAAEPEHLDEELWDLRMFNLFTGARWLVQECVRHSILRRPEQKAWTLLDVATGSADIPRHLVHWARRQGVALRVTATDLSDTTLEQARQRCSAYPEIQLARSDMRSLSESDESFDLVTCSQALHHLGSEDVVCALREMHRVARQAVIASDVWRSRAGYWAVWFGVHVLPVSRAARHDGPVSMLNGFRVWELRELGRQAGLHPPCLCRFRGLRFALTWLKAPAG